jgi:hypothetical protein
MKRRVDRSVIVVILYTLFLAYAGYSTLFG